MAKPNAIEENTLLPFIAVVPSVHSVTRMTQLTFHQRIELPYRAQAISSVEFLALGVASNGPSTDTGVRRRISRALDVAACGHQCLRTPTVTGVGRGRVKLSGW